MEPTSEQELKELLDEGKISEDEYRQLLEALHQKSTPLPPDGGQPKPSKSPERYGKIALILMIVGIMLPILGIVISVLFALSGLRILLGLPLFLIGLLCFLFAFIFGIIGFKSPAGKVAALGVPCLGLLGAIILPVLFFAGARTPHKAYPLDSLDGVLSKDITFDNRISADGNGSVRIQADSADKQVVRLFETGPLGVEGTLLIYAAQLRTEKLLGKAYLEMWCDFSGRGEFFSRGIQQPITGTTEWTHVETPFFLKTGQEPANVKLNVVIEGPGTVWIDDIKLLLSPL